MQSLTDQSIFRIDAMHVLSASAPTLVILLVQSEIQPVYLHCPKSHTNIPVVQYMRIRSVALSF